MSGARMRITSFLLSLLIHILVFLAALYGPFGSSSSPPVDLEEEVYEVELVRPAPQEEEPPEREQEPRESVQESAEEAQEEEKEPSPGKAATPAEKPERAAAEKVPQKSRTPSRERKEAKQVASRQERERDKPQARQTPTSDRVLEDALQDVREGVDREQKQREIVQKELERIKRESSSSGGSSLSEGRARRLYASLVQQQVKSNWRFPPVSGEPDLVARARVSIKQSGEIADYTLVESSGRGDFDDSVLRAIEETKSLPEPPEEGLGEITIIFDLREQRG